MSGEKDGSGFWNTRWGALAAIILIVGGLRGVWDLAVDLIALAEEPPILSPEEAIRPTGGNPFGLRVKQDQKNKGPYPFLTFGMGMQKYGEPEYSSVRATVDGVVYGWNSFDWEDTIRMNAADPKGGRAVLIMPDRLSDALKAAGPAQPPITKLTNVTVGYFFRKISAPVLSMHEDPTPVVPIVEALHAQELDLTNGERLWVVVGNPWQDRFLLGNPATAAVEFYNGTALVAEMNLTQQHLDAVAKAGSNGTVEWPLSSAVANSLKAAQVAEVETRIVVKVVTKDSPTIYDRTMTTPKTTLRK